MDTFSYLSVLFSVILGLALTEILQGFRRLIVARHKVIMYPPLLIWMGLVLLVVVQDWWAMFGLREVQNWTFLEYGAVLLLVTLLYLVAGLSVPEPEDNGQIDMEKTYFSHARWFFGLFCAAIVASLLKGYAFDPRLTLDGNFWFHMVFLVTSALASALKSRWYHGVLAPFMAVSFAAYIGLFFTRL